MITSNWRGAGFMGKVQDSGQRLNFFNWTAHRTRVGGNPIACGAGLMIPQRSVHVLGGD
jgi:hypothetical protein